MAAVRFSLAGKLSGVVGLVILATAAAAGVAAGLGLPAWSVVLGALVVGAPLGAWSLGRFFRPVKETLQALTDAARGFRENDFGVRVAHTSDDELGELVDLHNRMADVLQVERTEIFQRELLLDTLLQGAPMAIVLLNALGRVVYANRAARLLLASSGRLLGRSFPEIAAALPAPMAAALSGLSDAVFAVPRTRANDEEIYRAVVREFVLNAQAHRLVVIERITPELRRQEVETWKRVIRVFSHELNNSLAPVSSLVHSARAAASRPEHAHRVDGILGAVEERVKHLTGFLEGYARFARLPAPRVEAVRWRELLDGVKSLYPFELVGEPPEEGTFDRAQMQQVLINLVKNAVEAGSPASEIEVDVEATPDGTLLHVRDRGKGMDEETMRNALLPFYSSKETGSGLGLPLCNEIVAAHGGRLTVRARQGGGVAVTCVLPAIPPARQS